MNAEEALEELTDAYNTLQDYLCELDETSRAFEKISNVINYLYERTKDE